MTLAEKYGIQKGKEVEAISLNENPYKFEGTFKEFYELVAGGRVKALKQYGDIVGISVSGYDTIEADNLAGKAFAEAYGPMQAMKYLDLATQLVEANLIPTIVSENPLRITILNGLVTLDEYGNEVEPEVKKDEPKYDEETGELKEDTADYIVPGNIGTYGEKNIRNYIRASEGRCLARGAQLDIHYNAEDDVYEIRNIEWGRKLTEAERELIEYEE